MSNCETCETKCNNSLNSLTHNELLSLTGCKKDFNIKKGTTIFNEGDHVNGVYCINQGVCKISKMSENGREQIIHLIKDGDLLGERNLINKECANLKATAITDMKICFIPGETITESLHNNNEFTLSVLENMAKALKNTDNQMVNLGQKNVRQRLAHTLIYLQNRFGTREDNNIDINLSRDEIASIVGTTVETTIRLLSELKKKSIIITANKNIKITDLDALKKLAEN